MKKKILLVNEASSLGSGFSNIGREILPRLSEEFELGEIACYIEPGNQKHESFVAGRWKWWGVMPRTPQENAIFSQPSQHPEDQGQNINQFGALIFDKVCAEFKPDIVISFRDAWMDAFISRSPFRQWFKWIYMPTIDCEYQKEEWLDLMKRANLLCCYSDFGIETLSKEAPGLKLFPKPLRPGVDLSTFSPANKESVRNYFGINDKIKVIGSVFRNQSRKRILDLIDAFALMKNTYGDAEVKKSVLLIQSCWPDNAYSFDYPRHIMRLSTHKWINNYCPELKSSVLQVLKCHSCNKASLTFAANLFGRPIKNGAIYFGCMHCGQNTATPPAVGNGLTRQELAKVYNLMDLLVQFSISEGCGLPIQEAKACGIPTLVTNYSALSEKGREKPKYRHLKNIDNYTVHLGGELIEVDRFYIEPETSARRALTSISDASKTMRNLICSDLTQMKSDARKCVEENYNWDKNIDDWRYVLRNVKPVDRENTWNKPLRNISKVVPIEAPPNLNNEQYVEWLYINILKYPSVDKANAGIWINNLNNGVPREALLRQFIDIANREIEPELQRNSLLGLKSDTQEWI